MFKKKTLILGFCVKAYVFKFVLHPQNFPIIMNDKMEALQ